LPHRPQRERARAEDPASGPLDRAADCIPSKLGLGSLLRHNAIYGYRLRRLAHRRGAGHMPSIPWQPEVMALRPWAPVVGAKRTRSTTNAGFGVAASASLQAWQRYRGVSRPRSQTAHFAGLPQRSVTGPPP